jgi:hypothetical protein
MLEENSSKDSSLQMYVLLPRKLLFTLHVHSRNAEVVRLRRRKADFASTIMRPIDLLSCNPSLIIFEAFFDQGDELIIESIARAIIGVETRFEFFAWRSALLEWLSTRV